MRNAFKRRTETDLGGSTEPSFICPHLALGSYASIYADEIDRLRAVRHLIHSYSVSPVRTKPLCIGVFGAPGSGKSSAVASCVADIDNVHFDDTLIHNLSQMYGRAELTRFFRRIQDVIIRRKIPVAFFDEFDTNVNGRPGEWLRHFLMPMQDGKFNVGLDTFDLMPAIFIFAGGINFTYDKFASWCHNLKDAKGPDFLSRLEGYLEITSIDLPTKRDNRRTQFLRLAVQARRAVLLRGLLERYMPQIFDNNSGEARISNGIIDAFLRVKTFKSGIRSMRAIIEMSRVSGSSMYYEVASLPPRDQLKIHVDPKQFYGFATAATAKSEDV